MVSGALNTKLWMRRGFAMRSVTKAARLAPVTFSMTAPSTSVASEYSQPVPGLVQPVGNARFAVCINEPGIVDEVVGEPGSMGQQFADRRGPARRRLGAVGPAHPQLGELGEEKADRIVQVDLALLDKDHRCHRG